MLQIIKVGRQAPNIAVQSREVFVRKMFIYIMIIMKFIRIIVLKTQIIG